MQKSHVKVSEKKKNKICNKWSKGKRKCQLIIRLKFIKCYERFLQYLSSYKFLVLGPCSDL